MHEEGQQQERQYRHARAGRAIRVGVVAGKAAAPKKEMAACTRAAALLLLQLPAASRGDANRPLTLGYPPRATLLPRPPPTRLIEPLLGEAVENAVVLAVQDNVGRFGGSLSTQGA